MTSSVDQNQGREVAVAHLVDLLANSLEQVTSLLRSYETARLSTGDQTLVASKNLKDLQQLDLGLQMLADATAVSKRLALALPPDLVVASCDLHDAVQLEVYEHLLQSARSDRADIGLQLRHQTAVELF